jgi:hypothetical protein
VGKGRRAGRWRWDERTVEQAGQQTSRGMGGRRRGGDGVGRGAEGGGGGRRGRRAEGRTRRTRKGLSPRLTTPAVLSGSLRRCPSATKRLTGRMQAWGDRQPRQRNTGRDSGRRRENRTMLHDDDRRRFRRARSALGRVAESGQQLITHPVARSHRDKCLSPTCRLTRPESRRVNYCQLQTQHILGIYVVLKK